MKIRVKHYRVPKVGNCIDIRKGQPAKHMLMRYGRGVGWLNDEGKPIGTPTLDETLPPVPPLERGGKTVCEIIDDSDKENKLIAHAVAKCSMSDNFNYRIGKNIAVGRAKAAMSHFEMLEEFAA